MRRLFRFSLPLCLLVSITSFRPLATVGIAHAARPLVLKYAMVVVSFVRTREIETHDRGGSKRPLKGTMWYPAINPDGTPQTATYTDGLFSGTAASVRDA